ncbi:uncharacterized protein LOC144459834 [Epinephelus lanceolatus]
MLPLGKIIHLYGLQFHCYADDIQLYISTKAITNTTLSTLSNCLSEIKNWMQRNYLQLSSDKSDIIIIGPTSHTRTTQNFSTLSSSRHIWNLGIIFDSQLKFDHHFNYITRTAFFHLKNIARLRPSLTYSAAETLIHAFITSRLDYCNIILYGSSSKVLNKLQHIQNTAAHLLTHTRSREHITPVLQKRYWLPISHCIQYKILLLTTWPPPNSQTYSTTTPPPHSLRSSEGNLLALPPRTKHQTWGDRAFSVATPTLWNSLPKSIRDCTDPHTFKSLLKTHLFKLAFNL